MGKSLISDDTRSAINEYTHNHFAKIEERYANKISVLKDICNLYEDEDFLKFIGVIDMTITLYEKDSENEALANCMYLEDKGCVLVFKLEKDDKQTVILTPENIEELIDKVIWSNNSNQGLPTNSSNLEKVINTKLTAAIDLAERPIE